MDSPNHPVGRTHTLLARAKDALAYGGVFSAIEDVVDYPGGAFPQFADAGEGCRIRDTSGRWYIDWRNGWGSVVLGHRRAEVEAAIADQLRAGLRLSLMHPLEIEVAERIRDMVPCAERVAFGKNGSDATLAAVRVARAYTRRDVILQSGFHGFHDWYQGLRPSCEGIPRAVRELTASFPENNPGELEQLLDRYDGRVAAVIVEPASIAEPAPGYLDAVRALTHGRGALLVLDEVVTGFRLARGGAQEAYGVVPDVACLSKALANGMPLSAVVGRRDVMQVLPRVGYGMTYQGETLSLAAARATLEVHRTEPVAEHLARIGTRVRERFDADARGLGIAGTLVGIPARLRFRFESVGVLSPRGLLVLFVQECLKRGVLTDGSLYASYAHDEEAVERSATALRGRSRSSGRPSRPGAWSSSSTSRWNRSSTCRPAARSPRPNRFRRPARSGVRFGRWPRACGARTGTNASCHRCSTTTTTCNTTRTCGRPVRLHSSTTSGSAAARAVTRTPCSTAGITLPTTPTSANRG